MRTLVSEANKFHGGQTSTTANTAFKAIAGHVVTSIINNPLMQTFCGIGGYANSVDMEVLDVINFYSLTHCSLISSFICNQCSSLLYQCSSLLCLAPSLLRARMEQVCFLPHFKCSLNVLPHNVEQGGQVRVVGRQLPKTEQRELAKLQGKGVTISTDKNVRKAHKHGRDLNFFFTLNNEMLMKPGLCPNSSNTLTDAAEEDVTVVVVIDIAGRACDVLSEGLERKLGFDVYNRTIRLEDEFTYMNKLREETLHDKDKLKTKRQKALQRVNLEHAIEKLGGE